MISSSYQSFYHCFSSLSAVPEPARSDAPPYSARDVSGCAECNGGHHTLTFIGPLL